MSTIEYCSISDYESKLAPGVRFVLKKMSHGRRMELNRSTAAIFSEITDLQRQSDAMQEEIDRAEAAARIEPCTCKHVVDPDPTADPHDTKSGRCSKLGCSCRKPKPDPEIGDYPKQEKINAKIWDIIISQLYPAYVTWGVLEVQGLNIKLPSGVSIQATPETLLSDGPDFLVKELGEEIQRLMKLSPEEVMGFKQPTISGAVVAGKTNGSAAPIAERTNSTYDDIAASITPV